MNPLRVSNWYPVDSDTTLWVRRSSLQPQRHSGQRAGHQSPPESLHGREEQGWQPISFSAGAWRPCLLSCRFRRERSRIRVCELYPASYALLEVYEKYQRFSGQLGTKTTSIPDRPQDFQAVSNTAREALLCRAPNARWPSPSNGDGHPMMLGSSRGVHGDRRSVGPIQGRLLSGVAYTYYLVFSSERTVVIRLSKSLKGRWKHVKRCHESRQTE